MESWNWAASQAKDGKKVRRRCWLGNIFMKQIPAEGRKSPCLGLFLQAGKKEVNLKITSKFKHPSHKKNWFRFVDEYRSSDWELFEEDKECKMKNSQQK